MRVAVTIISLLALQSAAQANELTDRIHRLAHVFDDVRVELVPHGVADRLVRWQKSMRDFVHRSTDALATLAVERGVRIPDISVLTTEPVANTESSGFGWRDDPIRHRPKFHSGTDFRGKRGTPVVAAGDGVIVFAGRRGGYGNLIEIDHGGGVITRYAHLRRLEANSDNKAVRAGQQIGEVGSTGRATGPHLHFEVRLAGGPVDPVTAMTVAQLLREAPDMGRLAAFALTPEVQSAVASKLDPPKHRRIATAKKESRPDRAGRIKRAKPVS
ncbi:MAG TPA: M23 family metallopeptidase [Kofleriaceae bacterium]|nr:M23 family metallopeptidase [Kofleriaceae bacterium]